MCARSMRWEEETMAVKTKAKAAKHAPAAKPEVESRLTELLLARAPQEDVAGYSEADLYRAVAIANEAIFRHQPGHSLVDVRTDPGIRAFDRPIGVITVVN